MKPLLFSVRVSLAIAVLFVAATLVSAQPQQRIADAPTTGLSVTSAILEHKPYVNGRVLMVGLQNNSEKTVVGFELLVTELDGQGNKLSESGFGEDRIGPDAARYIRAGEPVTVRGLKRQMIAWCPSESR